MCGGAGMIEIADCPLRIVPVDVWEIVDMAELYEKGLPPVAGGSLDQARVFLVACRAIWADQAREKARRRAAEI